MRDAPKSSTIPPLRVSARLRREAERVLRDGETLSGFVLEAMKQSVEWRKAEADFIARGLTSAAAARKSGRYVDAEKVLAKLERRLARARKRRR